MDQIQSKSSKKMCLKHSQKKIKFVQVNGLNSLENNHLFYCTECINKDLAFKGINYLLISQIIDEGETNIIQKWPPVNDYSIIEKLIQFTDTQNSSPTVVHQINQYFTQLKEEFLRKVDLCEKKMINRALELPLGKDSIIQQYQQISQVDKLRTLLAEDKQQQSEDHEKRCRDFISEIVTQKEKNNELLSNLLQQCSQKEELISFEYPNLIKNSIFTFIDEIDFFNNNNTKNSVRKLEGNSNEISHSSKIMKLISNKSNFCSERFLSQLQTQLEKFNNLFANISFENMHEFNKSPINFSGLNETKLDIVKEFVDHQTKLIQNTGYSQNIETTEEYKYLESIVNSSVNSMSNNQKQQMKQYLTESYPLLKQVNFSVAFTGLEREKFNCFNSLSDIEKDDFYELIKKRRELFEDRLYKQSYTQQVQECTKNQVWYTDKIDQLFRKYPIFDLAEIRNLKLQLIKSKFQDGTNRLVITQDNQASIIQTGSTFKNGNYSNCVSNITLEQDKKYIFRFQIQPKNNSYFEFCIGLMQNSQCDINQGFNDKLSCFLKLDNNQIFCANKHGIEKYLKGNKNMILSENKEIEMRVWLGGQQLEVLDYPNYSFKIGILDQYKNKLVELNDLKVYIGLGYDHLQIKLASAFIVQQFPN